MKTRIFENYGIFISIIFSRNLDRIPAWRFVIETVEEKCYESSDFCVYEKCETEALKKAIEYLP